MDKNNKKFYDVEISKATMNFSAALDLLFNQNCYIYHDLMVEEDILSNGTHWLKYAYATKNGKTYKFYYETKKWGEEIKQLDVPYNKSKTWKAEKLEIDNKVYLDPGEDYLPYAVENKYIGSSFDSFLKEFNIMTKRDINWAVKMLEQGVIVYREEFPEVILFPIGSKNNPETKLTVDDLFAEDWTIFRGKSLKDVLDDFESGKSIRRKSWVTEYVIGKYSKDVELNLQDLKAHDWEVVDVVEEVNKIQKEHMRFRNEH